MKRTLPLVLLAVILSACSSVLLTGRKQLNLVSDSEVLAMSLQSYKTFIDSVPISTNKTNTAMVKKVGTKIAAAVESYMKANGHTADIANFAWEFNLVKDAQVNAFCMPGGKVVVYEGILPKTLTESGMAVVLGHEIAHAVARHSNERISQQMALQYGAAFTGILVSGKSAATQSIVNTVYGLGAQAGIMLPYSRKQEYEADNLGLIFMAMAGYNPKESVTFWERMTADKSSSSVDFMSTHPSDAKRIAKLNEELPTALTYYKK